MANGTIEKGITIAFKGDTIQFDKSVDGVNRALKTTKTELKDLNSKLKLDPSNVDLLKKKLVALGEQEKEVKEQIKLYQDAINNIDKKDIGGKEWTKLQQEISKANEQLARTQKYITETTNAIKGASFVNLGSSLEKAGTSAEKLGKALTPVSAVAGAITGAFAKMTKDASANADALLTMSKQYGISVEKLQQYQSASELVDVSLETMVKAHTKLTKAMGSTSKETQKAFNELGVAVKDANGEFRDSEDVFNEAIKKLGELENETQADIYANALFGKSFADLNPLIRGGVEVLDEWNKYLEENNLLLSEDQVNNLGSLDDAIQTLKGTLGQLGQIIASDIAPMITKALNKVNQVVLKLKDRWNALSPTMKKIIPIVSAIGTALAPILLIGGKLTKTIGSIVKSLGASGGLSTILKALTSPIGLIVGALGLLYAVNEDFRKSINDLVKTLWESIKPIIDTLVKLISDLARQLLDLLLPVINKIGKILSETIVPFIKKVVEAVMPIVETILDVAVKLINELMKVITKLFNKLGNSGVIDKITKSITNLLNMLTPLIEKLVNTLLPIITEIANFVVDNVVPIIDNLITTFVESLLPVIEQLIEAIMPFVEQWLGMLVELLGQVFDGIALLWEKLKETGTLEVIAEIIEKYISFIGDLISKLSVYLVPLIQLIANFISEFLMPVISKVLEIIEPIASVVLQGIIDGLGFLIEKISELFSWLEQIGIIEAFGKALDFVGLIIQKVVGFVKSLVEWITKLIDKIKELFSLGIDKIGSFFGGLFGDGANINVNANGGANLKGGANITLYNTINVSNANNITKNDVKSWGQSIVDVINNELGNQLG